MELLTCVGAFGGGLYALIFFLENERCKRRNQRFEITDRSNAPYREFLQILLEHPHLGMRAGDRKDVYLNLSELDRTRQDVIFEFLLSITENVFYLCDEGGPLHGEWPTWEIWIGSYAANPNFLRLWDDTLTDHAFGDKFMKTVAAIVGSARPQLNLSCEQ